MSIWPLRLDQPAPVACAVPPGVPVLLPMPGPVLVPLAAPSPISEDALFDIELRLLLEAIALRYQHDFRGYAPASLRRRVRHALGALRIDRLAELQARVLREPALFARLMQHLTVQVSDMFRDPPYFKALREQVMPELVRHPSLKFWVAGCGAGEEAWSLAILLHEEGLLGRSLIYATDINPQALQRARAGVFSASRASRYSANYLAAGGRAALADYCSSGYEGLLFQRWLKQRMVFADHSLATDSVFSDLHMVSCRNELIYFGGPLQARAVALFAQALLPRHGYLGLGSRESLSQGPHAAAFEAVCAAPEVRLYRKR